ncbi:Peptidoglycan/LPS O-acetylase OafA/YrhL, contains acyltransferase and SGNH-hydrolase domains [Agrococcus carbonis]|uniref:Peptidoglycan/LPS O-acetylase OafA/YrhL, contains acyltransferase and SGNH-hydrolase domains n=2 Tax=Agrococcus carbonis TaxID=684552 RepID=A0A1H1M4C3_9MICO|nr:Peptidoglycan/LPS O-acetylase OafA/YrhL, contains acyltransferase and SGNH-hydrolase domains [Agrococcus carbonis]
MIAVVSVIANHLAGWPVGGFVGVDVFFVISGFLITGLLVREHERTGRISFVDFYRRRIKRLMPAALLVLAVTVIGSVYLLPQPRAIAAAIDAAFAALFTVNWRLAVVGTDYFEAGQPPSPLQHYWSLSVEEQFYVVWPIVMVLMLWIAGRLRGDRLGRRRVLLAAASLIAVASFAWALLETATNPSFAYFSTLARAWELGIGAVLAIIVQTTRLRIPPAIAPWAGLAGTAGIIASCFLVLPEPGFPAPAGLLPVLSTALVIWAGVEGGERYERVNALLTNRVSHFLGDISYSLYLWHFPVIILGAALLPQESPMFLALALVATLLLSWASYAWVEDPARRSSWLTSDWRWRPRVVVGWAVGAAVVLGAGALVTTEITRPAEAVQPERVAPVDCFGANYLANGCSPEDVTGEITPAVDVMAEDTGGAYACWRVQGGPLQSCTYGSESEDALRVALVGDSHAAMLMPGLLPELEDRDWRMDTYLGYGCQWRDGGEASDCAPLMPEIDERLTSGDYDLIITSAARWATSDGAAEGFASAWADAIEAGSRVVAVADVPTVSEETLACLQRVGGDPFDCSTPVAEASQPADPLVAAAALEPRAGLVEVADRYCTDAGCPGVIGGVVVYRDGVSHTTGTYMRSFGPELVDRIRAAAGL